nr:ABC transporter substrate-binding protein [Sulfuracidifex tepidarius]
MRISKIVSLDPGATETIFMLGLGHLVKATDAFSYRPPEAKALPKIGSYTHVNYEMLDQISPDVILTSYGAQKNLVKKLIEEGYAVYPLPVPYSLNSILDNVILISNVLNAQHLAMNLQRKLVSIISQYTCFLRKSVKVYVEFDLGGPITIGYPTHVTHALHILGVRNVFDNYYDAYFEPDYDVLRRSDPDIVIYEPKRLTENEKVRFIDSIKKRNLDFLLDKKIVFSSGDFLAHLGPSFITLGLPWLASVLS